MRSKSVPALLGIITAVSVLAPARAWAAKPIERFVAFAVDTSEVAGRTRAGTVEIAVERWSTEEEQRHLQAALQEGGPEALLKALQKEERVGFIRSSGGLGYPLRFAHQVAVPGGGRRLLIATDRPISFRESLNRPRTIDYPFLLVDIRLDADGEGDGKLLPLAKVTSSDDNVVEIENYASVPVRLTRVRREKS
jgi:hypothetical protein